MLSVSCARAFASCLVRSWAEPPEGLAGNAPDLAELVAMRGGLLTLPCPPK